MTLLDQAERKGFRVWRDGDKLSISPWSKATEADRKWFAEKKQAILFELDGDTSKVGTTLVRVIAWVVPRRMLAKVPKESCGCTSYANKMDHWRIAGCLERSDEIADHLVEQANKISIAVRLIPKRTAATKMLAAAIRIEQRKQQRRNDHGLRR